MKTQTTNSRMRCPLAAVRYARILYDLGIPGEQVQKTREIFEEVPQLHDIFVNPTIALGKKMSVIDRVFPEEIRNFLKVVCKYQRMDLIPEIFTAYDDYCDEQNNVLNAARNRKKEWRRSCAENTAPRKRILKSAGTRSFLEGSSSVWEATSTTGA